MNDQNTRMEVSEIGGISGSMFKRLIEYLLVDQGVENNMYNTTKPGNQMLTDGLPQHICMKKLQVSYKTEKLSLKGRREKMIV